MRLIDADALLEEVKMLQAMELDTVQTVINLIKYAPTVQREEQDKLAGWVSVPIEPTHEMIKAMSESKAIDDEGEFPAMTDLLDYSGDNKTHTILNAAYKAMLSAAPKE